DVPAKLQMRNRDQRQLFFRWVQSDTTGKRRQALWKFLSLSIDTDPTEDSFKQSFGVGTAAANKLLALFLPRAVSLSSTVTPEWVRPPRIQTRSATGAEIARLKGEWERMEYTY